MAKSYRKTFPSGTPESYVRNEVHLQTVASQIGLAPAIKKTDYKTFVEMEDLKEMSVEDMYGSDINQIPPKILSAMWAILYTLYHTFDIEYIDVWPRNFIEKNGRVWIIDFGDAREICHEDEDYEPDEYLQEILEAGRITHWNPEFA
jgi:tRNA A-37 threonylcarbamoyl transferase component Bud32